jgi:hypothetical protein
MERPLNIPKLLGLSNESDCLDGPALTWTVCLGETGHVPLLDLSCYGVTHHIKCREPCLGVCLSSVS